jgi:hypothetical protein
MFASVCHFLNRIGFSWHVAALRFVLLRAFDRYRSYGTYTDPEAVGYLGWIKLPYLGPIAFVGLDGHRQYRW